jgi:hypothetical protein
MKKITEREYQNALSICLEYQKQIENEILSISRNSNQILLIDLFENGEISARFFNSVCQKLSMLLPNLKDVNYNLFTLFDLFQLNRKQMLLFRNCGKHTLNEFDNLKEKYK